MMSIQYDVMQEQALECQEQTCMRFCCAKFCDSKFRLFPVPPPWYCTILAILGLHRDTSTLCQIAIFSLVGVFIVV